MKAKLIFASLAVCFLFSCASETKKKEDPNEAPTKEELVEDFLEPEEDTITTTQKAEPEIDQSELEVNLKKVEVDPEKEKEKEQMKRDFIEKQYEKSENKGKSCDEILQEYDRLISDYIAASDRTEVSKTLAAWSDDVLYLNCRKKPEYSLKFDAIDEKMDELEDY